MALAANPMAVRDQLWLRRKRLLQGFFIHLKLSPQLCQLRTKMPR